MGDLILIFMLRTGAANGLFAVRVASLQKADPVVAVNFLYTLRMVSISID
jgi:hypothetical protein